MFGYKHGLHKVLRGNHKFDDTLFLLENEQNELIEVAQYPFQVYNRIAKELNDKKPREHVPDIVLEKGAAVVQGQYIKFIQQATEYKDSSRIVVAVFDEQEKDFDNVLHQFQLQTKKHVTCYFLALIRGRKSAQELKELYPDCSSLNLLEDQGQADKLLQENGMKKKQVFYVFQNFQLDCACSDLNKM